jgi:hypothetical protein
MLFSEIRDQKIYSLNIYNKENIDVGFKSISNLFHPKTIDDSFISNGLNDCPTFKKKLGDKFVWDLNGHRDRVIEYNAGILSNLGLMFGESEDIGEARLPRIHSSNVLNILSKFNSVNKIGDKDYYLSFCWHETNDQTKGNIFRTTHTPDGVEGFLIYSGPHIFTSTSYYKSPRKNSKSKADFDTIHLEDISENYLPNSNYNLTEQGLQKLKILNDKFGEKWLEKYKLAFRMMLNHTADRTLNGAIIPPNTSHVNSVLSISFKSNIDLVLTFGYTCSLLVDFFLRMTGSSNLNDSKFKYFPILHNSKYKSSIILRSLKLSCSTSYYKNLWDSFVENEDFINDMRNYEGLYSFSSWKFDKQNLTYADRRKLMIEIDVLVAMSFSISLSELINLYKTEFNKLNDYEEGTWYDSNGRILYTPNNQGLVGVGVDTKELSQSLIEKELNYTITKSEMYKGKVVKYNFPFYQCDRVEDYKVAWEHFEKIFNQN